jgi:protein phosphatase
VDLTVTDPALVLLVGPSGSGKSTFAARSFPSAAVLSSDELRRRIADDPNDQSASAEAFRVLTLLLNGRLRRRLLSVVDATNLRPDSRRRWLRLARGYGVPATAIVFDLPLETCLALNAYRDGRQVEEAVVRDQHERLRQAIAALGDEGYDQVYFLRHPADVAAATVRLLR